MAESKVLSTTMTEDDVYTNDKVSEKKLLRKIDLRIIPIITVLYLISFLDRVNIGNAKLDHIEHDLGLVGNQFNWCLSIFFVGYLLFEVPSNFVLLKTSPSIWLPLSMLLWGTVQLLMPFARNFSGLMALRFFLGLFEAALPPGSAFFITMWYRRSEQSSRFALFTATNAFAGCFSGILSYAVIGGLEGRANLQGWQWLFLIEGMITIAFSISAFFFIPDYPENAKWLSDDERILAVGRLKSEIGRANVTHFNKVQVLAVLKDWKVYATMFHLGLVSIPLYSFALFLPSIINGLGFGYVISQLVSAPPFFLSGVSTLVVCIISDRTRIRGPIIIACSFFSLLGYILLIIPTTGNAGKYVGICIIGIGLYPAVIISMTWLANNLAGNVKRGIAIGFVVMLTNFGAIIASQIYQQKDFPHYYFGHSLAMAFLFAATAIAILQYFLLKSINKAKRENPQSFLEGKSEEEINNMGDLHPDFIYFL